MGLFFTEDRCYSRWQRGNSFQPQSVSLFWSESLQKRRPHTNMWFQEVITTVKLSFLAPGAPSSHTPRTVWEWMCQTSSVFLFSIFSANTTAAGSRRISLQLWWMAFWFQLQAKTLHKKPRAVADVRDTFCIISGEVFSLKTILPTWHWCFVLILNVLCWECAGFAQLLKKSAVLWEGCSFNRWILLKHIRPDADGILLALISFFTSYLLLSAVLLLHFNHKSVF